MHHLKRIFVAVALSALLCVGGAPSGAATPAGESTDQSSADIFNPDTAPVIVLHIGARRIVLTPKFTGTATTITATQIANNPNQSFVGIVEKAPGVAVSSSGEIHVRGSHGQYTYYLDGAPLPSSVTGSFEELINPKNIQSLNIYTGGFPPALGDDMAAIFDVTAKAGDVGPPHGFVSEWMQGNSTYETAGQVEGGKNRFTYFLSGLTNSTNRDLDPVTEDPIHDAGDQSVLFGKFDYQAGRSDKLILDTAGTSSFYQIPDTPLQLGNGVSDTQKENGDVVNLIWQHTPGADKLVTALYSHSSEVRYFPSSGDLIGASPANPLAMASERQTANYYGIRVDYSHPTAGNHVLGIGTDDDTVTDTEHFHLIEDSGSPVTYIENANVSGNNRAVWVQDDWSPGRWRVNYGVRWDDDKAALDTSQYSPRLNLIYIAGRHDKFHADYDREFQPVAVEDVRQLDPTTAPFLPERDNFYEAGYQHDNAGYTETFSAYYKTEQDVVDENTIAGTIILEPFNVQKGYVRGLEWTVGGPIARSISFYGNYSRSWAQSAGQFTGGFIPYTTSPNYFYDDHDQTDTASVGAAFQRNGTFVSIDGEYGSGFPYGTSPSGQVNYIWTEPHFIVDASAGAAVQRGTVEFTVINVLNHPYIITEGGVFGTTQWGEGRTFGVKYTYTF